MSKALVIFSGGQDSTTCLFWAKKRFTEVHVITFDYGQRHALEIIAAKDIAHLAEISSHEVIESLPRFYRAAPRFPNVDEAQRVRANTY